MAEEAGDFHVSGSSYVHRYFNLFGHGIFCAGRTGAHKRIAFSQYVSLNGAADSLQLAILAVVFWLVLPSERGKCGVCPHLSGSRSSAFDSGSRLLSLPVTGAGKPPVHGKPIAVGSKPKAPLTEHLR